MSRLWTILLGLLAVAAIVFLVIYEPLTSSTREQAMASRDGRVFSFDPAAVREIHLSSSSGELDIKRKGNGWQIGPRPRDRADARLVAQLLKTAANLEFYDRIPASEFRDDSALGEYGLKNPKRKIELRGDRDLVLYIGKDGANEDRLYVRRGDSRDVFLVSDDILDVAFSEVSRFRDRRLTDLEPSQVDRFVIRRPGGEMEFVQEAGGWRMVKPLNAPANEKAVQEFLARALAVKINEFVADDSGDLGAYGVAEGAREISFFADGRERAQSLRLGSDIGEDVYAQFTARDTVYRLPRVVTSLLDVTPDSFRDRRLLPLNLDMVDLIRFKTPSGDFSLRRNDSGWIMQSGGSTGPASAAAVQAMIDALSTTQVVSYFPAVADKLAAHGLAPARTVIEFVSVLSENTPEMKAGERVIESLAIGNSANGQVALRLGDAPEFVAVPDALMAGLRLDPSAWASPR